MYKCMGWIVTIIGILLVLALIIPATFSGMWFSWVIAILVLIVGISKICMCKNWDNKK